MKMLSIILLSVLVNTCTKESEDNTAPLIEANAIIFNNNLPVDGCAEHISLIDAKGDKIKDVLPTEASSAVFTNLLKAEIAKLPANTYSGNIQIPVILKYKTTQEKGDLVCGWGNKSTVEKIEIVNITKK
ncbi:MAG: hypothetical protein ACOVO2_12535 [Emticicia sp.]|uniref:hypothetical protein n=1 Tax=Emticicia sp. TaxID=1930953 RepID=UPI003BA55FEB